jgi:flagellar protein FliO/FliZ
METLFGTEMPIAMRIILALVIVIGLASGVFYVLRYVSADRLGGAGMRGRQPRLAVIEVAGVDTRRRLLLIRRDNVEHLIMIGGPSDVVVEANIVRAVAVSGARDTAPARIETVPRPAADGVPLPRPAAADGAQRPAHTADQVAWPSEPATRSPRVAKAEETNGWPQHSEVASARAANITDPLAGLAAELGRTAGHAAPAQAAPTQATPAHAASVQANAPQATPVAAPAAAASDGATIKREPKRPPPPAAASSAPTPDQNLTEMAQRLEAALRHSPGASRGEPNGKSAPELSVVANRSNGSNGAHAANGGIASGASDPARAGAPDLRASRPSDAKPVPKAVYDNLEQEMASLLGRPAGKT